MLTRIILLLIFLNNVFIVTKFDNRVLEEIKEEALCDIIEDIPLSSVHSYDNNVWTYKPFDESMQTEQYPKAIDTTKKIVGIEGEVLFSFFKNLFEKNNVSQIDLEKENKIPKIIHQIWLGSPVPHVFTPFILSWKMYENRGWKYKLWTDKDIEQLPLYNQKLYDASNNAGEKSDIARWEILYRFGGVYVDMDFECLQPLDILHYAYDFYVGIQPLDTLFVQLGAALVGSRAGHPILKYCIETIAHNQSRKGVTQKTGPVHLTRSFYAAAGHGGLKDIALPASYFYPLGCREKAVNKQKWIQNGAFAVHWWSKSWMPKPYRPNIFRKIENEKQTKDWNS